MMDDSFNYTKIFIIMFLPFIFIFLFCYIKIVIDREENPEECNTTIVLSNISEPLPIYTEN